MGSLAAVATSKGGRVLEVGAGTGLQAPFYAANRDITEVTFVDASRGMLDGLRAKLSNAPLPFKTEVVEADAARRRITVMVGWWGPDVTVGDPARPSPNRPLGTPNWLPSVSFEEASTTPEATAPHAVAASATSAVQPWDQRQSNHGPTENPSDSNLRGVQMGVDGTGVRPTPGKTS